MKIKSFTLLTFCFGLTMFFEINAQKSQDATAYLSSIEDYHRKVKEDYLFFNSAIIYNKNPSIVSATGKTFVKTLKKTRKKIVSMPAYAGDAILRDSTLAYLDLYFNVLMRDYSKILDTEEIIEQSFDIVEAVLLAEDLARIKLEMAKNRFETTKKDFASKYQVQPQEVKNKIDERFEETEDLNSYFQTVFSIFIKNTRQEKLLWESLSEGNINVVEQRNNTLFKYNEEGLALLDNISCYKGDSSLILSCRTLLQFYRNESLEKIPYLIDYLIKDERLKKLDKTLEARLGNKDDLLETELYNLAAFELNEISFDIDNDNVRLTAIRLQLLDNWFKESNRFLRRHTP